MELQLFQAMWTIEQRVARIADAGFAGLAISFSERELALRVCAPAVERGLRIIPLAFPTTVDELRPVLDLVADVGRELAWPVDDTSHAQIGRILDHARAYHGRVATREQVQVQIGFPQHAQWV